jgi:hypothetical protein
LLCVTCGPQASRPGLTAAVHHIPAAPFLDDICQQAEEKPLAPPAGNGTRGWRATDSAFYYTTGSLQRKEGFSHENHFPEERSPQPRQAVQGQPQSMAIISSS